MLSKKDVKIQARRRLYWVSRGKDVRVWERSKDFEPEDLRAIRAEYKRLRESGEVISMWVNE